MALKPVLRAAGNQRISAAKFLSVLVLLSLLMPGAAHAIAIVVLRYVVPGGLNSGACASWADACDLQYALVASDSSFVYELWVKQGMYKPGSLRGDTFTLKNGFSLYGGFAGTETLLSQRDPATHVTVLSGNIGLPGLASDNSYHVVSGGGAGSTAVLDGLTITAGNANGGSYPDDSGGGMLNGFSSPTLTNVTFSGNSASDLGGGMSNSASSPTLTNVTFAGNSSDNNGGGMVNFADSRPALTNVTFNGNSAKNWGGGMYNVSSGPTVTNVTFVLNSADSSGGGMVNASSSSPTLTDVTFANNSAGVNGSGMENESSSPMLRNVTFVNNSAGGNGGGMDSAHSSPTMTNITFSGNSAVTGGGMYNSDSTPSLTNVTFAGNSAGTGGGMDSAHSSPTMTNITFSGNSAVSGGGMYNSESTPSLTNVTFSGNSAGTGGAMVNVISNPVINDAIVWGDGTEFNDVLGSVPVINDSVVAGGCPPGASCNTNIMTTDPRLGPLQDNGGLTQTMALGAGSPAVDAGGAIPPCATSDQRGVLRPQGPACDIGAFESVYFSISGNAGTGGALLSYAEGSTPADGGGLYSFTVPHGWSGAVTPSKTGYSFAPDHRNYTNVLADQTSQDYTATFMMPPQINHVYPADGSQACRVPQVGVDLLLTDLLRMGGSFDPSTIMLTLDGTDVTGSASSLQTMDFPASRASVFYTSNAYLALGPHQAGLTYPTASGPLTLLWDFTVADIPCPTGGAHSPASDEGPQPDFRGIDSP